MKCHVFKRSRMVNGVRIRAKTYSGRYRLSGDLKDVEIALEVKDKQAAVSELAAIVKHAEMERQGLSAPSRQIQTAGMPLQSVIRDWVADLAAKGTKPGYYETMEKMMGVLTRGCHWTKVADIGPETFIRWRGANQSKAPKTLNEYLGCVRALLNWLVKSGRLPANPLASVGKVETRGRTVRNRRALTHEEFLKLLEVAGPDRGVVYAVAYYTGLRRAEVVSLFWSSFDLAANPPTVTIEAKHAKNKKSVPLPLHVDLREMLASYFDACGSPALSTKALKVPPRLRAYNRDLEAAGIAKMDESGLIVDFHSLRHSTATRLAAENIPLSVAMRIMRHSDPKLTAKAYVRDEALALAPSVGMMPGMSNRIPLSPHSSLDLVGMGQTVADRVASLLENFESQPSIAELLRHLLSHLGAMGHMAPALGIEPRT